MIQDNTDKKGIYHVPVLLNEVIEFLIVNDKGIYIDATLGGGGHFREVLSKLKEGVVIGIDMDEDAINKNSDDLLKSGWIEELKQEDILLFKKESVEVILVHSNFNNMSGIIQKICTILNREILADGILFDLGVSSYQIDEASKGFSYMKDSPLDMRMDKRLAVKAEDLINGMYEKELEYVLRSYGEESFSRKIARAIVNERKKGKIDSSVKLNEVIKKSVPFFYKNPYAKTYQALRIAVNGELDNLLSALEGVDEVLDDGGRIAVISFHSLEDRIVKQFFAKSDHFKQHSDLLQADNEEIDENKRARSAKLRFYEKTNNKKN